MTTKNFPSAKLKWGLVILLLLWIFAVAGVFYVVQKPFHPADVNALLQVKTPPFVFSAAALGRSLLDMLAALWLWVAALGVGLWVYRWLMAQGGRQDNGQDNIPSDATSATLSTRLRTGLSYKPVPSTSSGQALSVVEGLEALVFGSGLGLGALGLLILFIGLAGLITKPIFYGVAVLLTLIALPQLIALTRTPPHPLTPSPPRPLARLYLALTLGLGLTIALLPPTDWDGLFYHLTGPKLHIAAGQIAPGIDIPHLNFPGLFEMLYMLAMVIRGDAAAKLLHFGFSLLLAGLVYLTAKRHLGLKNGWLAVLFLFSMPMVLTLAGWAYNDLALAFYQAAALYALLRWRQGDKERGRQRGGETISPALSLTPSPPHPLILSGLFCGFAMSLKYTSVVAPITLGGLLLWHHWRKRTSLTETIKSALTFALPALLVAAPWYIKNWIFTGNPVYPFVFEGLFWDGFRSAAYSGAGSGIGFDLIKLISLPVELTLGIYDANYIDGRSGPLFLAFLPLLLAYGVFRYRRKAIPPAMNWLLFFALVQYVFWTLGVVWSAGLWQSRLLLPAFTALSPVMAWIVNDIAHLDHPQFSLRRFLGLFIAVVLLLGIVDQLFNNQAHTQSGWLYYRPFSHLIGPETRPEYLTRRLGVHYATMEEINAQLPPDAVVAFLWEPRSYYCRVDCRPDSILDKYGHLQYLRGQDAEAIAKAWREEDVTHVLVFRLGLDFLLKEEGLADEIRPDPKVLNQLEAEYFEPVIDVAGAYQVYRLKEDR